MDYYAISQLQTQIEILNQRIEWMQEIIERPTTSEEARKDLREAVYSMFLERVDLTGQLVSLQYPHSQDWNERTANRRDLIEIAKQK